jgi:hypothetical protein
MKNLKTAGRWIRPAALSTLLLLVSQGALAQGQADGKTAVPEPAGIPVQAAQPFVPFNLWVTHIQPPAPAPVATLTQEPMQRVSPAGTPFEAMPVIAGQPDLPLLGEAAAQAAQQWNAGLNYQGLTMSYIVFDAKGAKRELRTIDKGLAAGERFRIRYTATYESVAALDYVLGSSPWAASRAGQAWPQAGMSVQARAGETVELPLNPNAYFRLGSPNERLVLTVRHPQAKDAARSNQPAYRQDGATGSQYLQLLPPGSYPAIEQLISTRVR